MAKISVTGLNLDSLSADQLALIQNELAKTLGTSEVKLVAKTDKVKLGQLEGKLDADNNYACNHCKTVVNLDSLNDDDRKYAIKYGICPVCAQKVRDAEEIKSKLTKRNAPRLGDSAKSIAEAYIDQYADQIDEQMMMNMLSKDWCRQNMSLSYALFKELPAAEMTAAELKDFVSDDRGKRRYGARIFQFKQLNGRRFIMTNDHYKPKVNKIGDVLAKTYAAADETVNNDEKVDLTKAEA